MDKKFDKLEFENPSSEFRGAPFWAWNDVLDKDELLWQIEQLRLMGFGGFHMHSRSGMATPYLSEEFFDNVFACVKQAKSKDMKAYLYDEDRYPSGSAGGFVTKNKEYRQKILIFSTDKITDKDVIGVDGDEKLYTLEGIYWVYETFIRPRLEIVYDVVLDEQGYMTENSIISEDDQPKGTKWYVYSVTAGKNPWFNNQAYIDTLDEKAVSEFINLTYEKYHQALSADFGTVIPSMFTDEPQFACPMVLPSAKSKGFATIVWTRDIKEKFYQRYNQNIFDKLPELFWDLKDGFSKFRYDFREFVCQTFTESYFKQCGDWCRAHNIKFIGHDLHEDTLSSQTQCLGEAMRTYVQYDMPGIDMLCDDIALPTVKQCQSIVRQCKKSGMMSELYGVTGWDFDFRGHKFQGDWQAALGVTLRVPHLSWVSMKGSAKRDCPASINYQSAWYKEYNYIEDHFARVNYVLTKGKPIVNIGVIHPVESMWLNYGPLKENAIKIKGMEENFKNLTEWLTGGCLDFDFISESVLKDIYKYKNDNLFNVGEMAYQVVVVPPIDTIRKTTIERLEKFADNGGKIIWAGNCPKYVDGLKSDLAKGIFDKSDKVMFTQTDIITALEPYSIVKLATQTGDAIFDYTYTLREAEDCKWLFLARIVKPREGCHAEGLFDKPNDLLLTVKGEYQVELYNTLNGQIEDVEYYQENAETLIKKRLYNSDSMLIRLKKGKGAKTIQKEHFIPSKIIDIKDGVDYTLSEPNVLVLDMPKWSLDGKEYNPNDELLRIDALIREELDYPASDGLDVQPWVEQEKCKIHDVYLKFEIESDIEREVRFAFEELQQISLNGKNVPIKKDGYFTDKRIYTMPLGKLQKGMNVIELKTVFSKKLILENYFLLGDFGVKVSGCKVSIIEKPSKIHFGNLTNQGFPFYSANFTYVLPIETQTLSDIEIETSKYKGAVVTVKLDGKDCGKIAFSPYTLKIEDVETGKHKIEITVCLTRNNSFGALHCARDITWKGFRYWYTTGMEYAYEYQLSENGILKSPIIKIFDK